MSAGAFDPETEIVLPAYEWAGILIGGLVAIEQYFRHQTTDVEKLAELEKFYEARQGRNSVKWVEEIRKVRRQAVMRIEDPAHNTPVSHAIFLSCMTGRGHEHLRGEQEEGVNVKSIVNASVGDGKNVRLNKLDLCRGVVRICILWGEELLNKRPAAVAAFDEVKNAFSKLGMEQDYRIYFEECMASIKSRSEAVSVSHL